MKRILLILFIILSISSAVGAEVIEKTIEPSYISRLINKQAWQHKNVFYENGKEVAVHYLDKNDNFLSKNGKVPDSVVHGYYPNKVMENEAFYKNNMLNGPYKIWRDNGVLEEEGTYVNDKLNGVAITYYENGNKETEAYLRKDIQNGLQKDYYENGVLKDEVDFVNGSAEGVLNAYYENGLLKAKYTYKNGKLNGIAYEYFHSGNIKSIYVYSQNKIIQTILNKSLDISGKNIYRYNLPFPVIACVLLILFVLLLDDIRDPSQPKKQEILYRYIAYFTAIAIYYYPPHFPISTPEFVMDWLIIVPLGILALFSPLAFCIGTNIAPTKNARWKISLSHLILAFLFIGGWQQPFNEGWFIYLYILFGSQLTATGSFFKETILSNWLIFGLAFLCNFIPLSLNDTLLPFIIPWESIFTISNWIIAAYLCITLYFMSRKEVENASHNIENTQKTKVASVKEKQKEIESGKITDKIESLKQLAKYAGKRIKVLAIDDMAGVLESYKEILKIANVDVITALYGETGLKLLTPDYDMVFTGLNQPGMRGTEILKAVKERFPFMPVAIITAYAPEDFFANAIKYGAYEYLRKPFLMGELYDLVEKCFKLRHEAKRK